MAKRNKGMFGGAENKDPSMQEYEGFDLASETHEDEVSESEPEMPQSETRMVKIPMNWGNKFSIEYDNGQVIEYGRRGRISKPPAGAKPLCYIVEALD